MFEDTVREVCRIAHDHGGQVYIDGANMNALVGLVKPGEIGGDVSHLNLHKTFAIPHGGGGPGMGPIGVKAHLAPFLPADPRTGDAGQRCRRRLGVGLDPADFLGLYPDDGRRGADAGDAGGDPERQLHRQPAGGGLSVLFMGNRGRVAHECILDTRPFAEHGVTVDDIAKRLIDNGFHAPTMSWPVAGTLMVEPTESETKAEIDRLITAFLAIRAEITEVAEGRISAEASPAPRPHTVEDLVPTGTAPIRASRLLPARRLPGGQILASGRAGGQRLWRPASDLHLPPVEKAMPRRRE